MTDQRSSRRWSVLCPLLSVLWKGCAGGGRGPAVPQGALASRPGPAVPPSSRAGGPRHPDKQG
jgi:hypothetical protein